FLNLDNFATPPTSCVQTACRMNLFTQAKSLGIQTEFMDGQGHHRVTGEAALKIILDALPAPAPHRLIDGPVVIHCGAAARTELPQGVTFPLRWKIVADLKVIADGESQDGVIAWPLDLPVGTYRLHLADASCSEEVPLIVAPRRAFDGDFGRGWILAVQLYGVRSVRNWGMGDFTDLEGLIELANALGADGVGLNPLHVLFDDRPGDCSPYSPNSRLFLNALYIDVAKIPEFSTEAFSEADETTPRLRQSPAVDYIAVAELKWRALRSAFRKFCAEAKSVRKEDFAKFRDERASLLSRFACFEVLRHRFN